MCAFDIETTRIKSIDNSVMYLWQFATEDGAICGRTWEELALWFAQIISQLSVDEYIVVYVHNLSYEFQFLSGVFDFRSEDVFAVDSRKVLYARLYDHIEFRCSYLLTHMSLDKFLKSMNVHNQKLTLDYDKERWFYTELTDNELEYGMNDVIGLVQGIRARLDRDNDTLATIPYTSTGYVRREFKKALQPKRLQIRKLQPSWELYQLAREAFRGGNTHANRHFVGMQLSGVRSRDKVSSYPTQQLTKKYPMSEFKRYNVTDINDLLARAKRHNYAWIASVAIRNLKLRDESWGCPYLSIDKCRNIDWGDSKYIDNGRILEANYLETTITDVDLSIIDEEYEGEYQVLECYVSRYAYLPKEFTDLVLEMFRNKTELKGVDDYLYARYKEMFNALYGMTAQDPAKIRYIYDGEWKKSETDREEQYNDDIRHNFLTYMWGVWCTAWARRDLEDGIRLVHDTPGAFFIYCDTDSVKYIGIVDWSEINGLIDKASEERGGAAYDKRGVKHTLGEWEFDGYYVIFVTWGAKRYSYIDKDGLHLTCAGVPKAMGISELLHAGGIDAFKPGFIFRSGKLEAVYNDYDYGTYITPDGIDVRITKNVCLRPTTYLLSLTEDYMSLLQDVKEKHLTLMRKNGKIMM